MLRHAVVWALVLAGGCDREEAALRVSEAATTPAVPAAPAPPGATLELLDAPGFIPLAFSDDHGIWGIRRGRLARLQLADGSVEATRHTAWSVSAGPGVVSWRNELGAWVLSGEVGARRLAPTELVPGYDGPPEVLWSPDGRRAVLSWAAEWDFHHALLHEDRSLWALATALAGYMLDRAVLWLDSGRVLFQVVASAPVGGEPAYRESGWRGDLAVLELHGQDGHGGDSTSFRRVTQVPDGTFLHAAGLVESGLLVTEWRDGAVAGHWLYDPGTWTRRQLELPAGRAWGAGRTIVSYHPLAGTGAGGEPRLQARLFALPAGDAAEPALLLELGLVADPAGAPAISPDGRRTALRVVRGAAPQTVLATRTD